MTPAEARAEVMRLLAAIIIRKWKAKQAAEAAAKGERDGDSR